MLIIAGWFHATRFYEKYLELISMLSLATLLTASKTYENMLTKCLIWQLFLWNIRVSLTMKSNSS